jgi:hypothetical protein
VPRNLSTATEGCQRVARQYLLAPSGYCKAVIAKVRVVAFKQTPAVLRMLAMEVDQAALPMHRAPYRQLFCRLPPLPPSCRCATSNAADAEVQGATAAQAATAVWAMPASRLSLRMPAPTELYQCARLNAGSRNQCCVDYLWMVWLLCMLPIVSLLLLLLLPPVLRCSHGQPPDICRSTRFKRRLT